MKILHCIGMAAIIGAGCASIPAPNDEISGSMAAIRGAQEVGAKDVPAAALALKLAEDEVATAKALTADGKHEKARFMAVRATNDAELALALARLHQARAKAAKASDIPAPTASTP